MQRFDKPWLTIRSGGQSGVDRAALTAAVELGMPYTGWCPQGGWAEDFPEPPGIRLAFPGLRETPSTVPEQRTAWNVRDADATLILSSDSVLSDSPGTRFAKICAESIFDRPFLIVGPEGQPDPGVLSWLKGCLGGERISLCLNVAGPRESETPGIFLLSRSYLVSLFRLWEQDGGNRAEFPRD